MPYAMTNREFKISVWWWGKWRWAVWEEVLSTDSPSPMRRTKIIDGKPYKIAANGSEWWPWSAYLSAAMAIWHIRYSAFEKQYITQH